MLMIAVLVASAVAGFAPVPELGERMQPIAGKEITVYCAESPSDWSAYVASQGGGTALVSGHTPVVGGDETYLSYDTCATLRARLAGKGLMLSQLAPALFTLTHEVQHLRGIENEHDQP